VGSREFCLGLLSWRFLSDTQVEVSCIKLYTLRREAMAINVYLGTIGMNFLHSHGT
jgi:hypothetical protein